MDKALAGITMSEDDRTLQIVKRPANLHTFQVLPRRWVVERVALITGAASGIGAATARRLAAEGAAVLVTDVSDAGGAAVAGQLGAAGGRAAYQHLDVVSEQDWQRAVAAAVERFGGLDILVNNAGVHGEPEPIEDVSLASWERSIAVLQTGVFLGLKHAAPALLGSGHAAAVNISSIFGASGGFGTSPAYHAAKGAVRVLTKNAALRWARRGIRVNSVHPGFIDTPLLHPNQRHWAPGRWLRKALVEHQHPQAAASWIVATPVRASQPGRGPARRGRR